MSNSLNFAETTLTLQVCGDGSNWSSVAFTGEDPAYVDAQAAAYVRAYSDIIEIAIPEDANLAVFTQTFKALQRTAVNNDQVVAHLAGA